jgi:hypothetical protein
MGVSAHLQACFAQDGPLGRSGYCREEKTPNRLVQLLPQSHTNWAILTFATFPQSTHTVSFALLWMIIEDESFNVNSVHDPHSVYTVNNEQDSSFKNSSNWPRAFRYQCCVSLMNVVNLSLRRALVGTEVREIQKSYGKECACLKTISAHKCHVGPYRFFFWF